MSLIIELLSNSARLTPTRFVVPAPGRRISKAIGDAGGEQPGLESRLDRGGRGNRPDRRTEIETGRLSCRPNEELLHVQEDAPIPVEHVVGAGLGYEANRRREKASGVKTVLNGKLEAGHDPGP